ncbi:hypothetical protein [Streptomyces sp. FH025]|uniref:hypothetical protein n=1 Tax=Streptomyces sp. FH025 TaxID=2815937 RepID=UPI001A9EFE5A|nr:hypothetical protein [Streptomyces sp. FH025]MBO1413202.1 hypothetical protein [Streptomyces sp. FH025]
MMLRVPVDLPATALRVGDLRGFLGVMPDDLLVVADCPGQGGPGRTRLGWPVKAAVRDESGRRVPVVALPQVAADDEHAMTVSRLYSLLADLPADAPVVTVWEVEDGPRQTTIGTPEFGDLINQASGLTVRAVILPAVLSGATGTAYDEIAYNLGWE